MAMSTEDRIAAGQGAAAQAAATAANGGVDPGLTKQYGITDPDLAKYLGMASMPATIAWGDPSAGGSRSQEQAAARAAAQFTKAGGQAELDRITAKIAANPTLRSQLQAVTAAGNSGDFFSKIGDAFVSIVPTALKAAVLAGVGDIAMGGALIGGAESAGAGASAAYDPIAAMSGAGSGVSDFAVLNSAMSAPGAMVSGSLGNAAIGLGYDTLGTAATGALEEMTTQQLLQQALQQGVPQEVVQQAVTNPSIMDQIKQFIAPASSAITKIASGDTTGTSWMDYLSTGLGLVKGIQGITGGNSQDAGAAQRATDPFAPYRAQYAQQLNQLMADPSSVTSLPGYQFQQQQGQQAVERQLAAQGRTVSGQEQIELQKYGQGQAGQYYNDQYNKLAQLSGASASPALGGAAYNTINTANQTQQQAGWGQLGTLAAGAATPNNPINRAVTGAGNFLSNLWR